VVRSSNVEQLYSLPIENEQISATSFSVFCANMALTLKEAIHCLKDNECSKDTCNFFFSCIKIRAKLKKGFVMDFNGIFHKATKQEIKFYEKNFGKEWVKQFLGTKGEK